MKHGRNPNRAEKKILARNKKDSTEWLFVESKIHEEMDPVTQKMVRTDFVDVTFSHRKTGELLTVKERKNYY